MSFKTKQEAFAAMQAALATIQKIKAPLPKPFQDLVDKCIKVVAANTKTADATAKKAAPDLGDKDPQGAGIDALIEKSSLPKSVKDTLLEKYNNLSDEETTIFSNFLSKLEKFYSDHKNNKAYFEAQKTTIEGLMIALIKKDGATLVLPTIPFVNDPTIGVEYKKVSIKFKEKYTTTKSKIIGKIGKCEIQISSVFVEGSITFAFDKNIYLQYKKEIDFAFAPDIVANFFKFSNTDNYGINNKQLANAISIGATQLEWEWRYGKIVFKIEGPKLSSFENIKNKDNILIENWRLSPIGVAFIAELNLKNIIFNIFAASFPGVKDIESTFHSAKCAGALECKLETELICDILDIGQDSAKEDKKKVKEIKKESEILSGKAEKLEIESDRIKKLEAQVKLQKQKLRKSDKVVMEKLSEEIQEHTKNMVTIAESIGNKEQKEIAEGIIKNGGKALLKKASLKLFLKFIPVVNVISTIYDVVELTMALASYFRGEACDTCPDTELPFYITPLDSIDDNVPPHLRN